jgi:hypothetical protein
MRINVVREVAVLIGKVTNASQEFAASIFREKEVQKGVGSESQEVLPGQCKWRQQAAPKYNYVPLNAMLCTIIYAFAPTLL